MGYTFTTLSGFPGGPAGINDSDQIVGSYTDSGGTAHGFIYTNGTVTTLNVPSSLYGGSYGTNAMGINNAGQVVGWFTYDLNRSYVGFEYSNGTYSVINPANASDAQAIGINNGGQIFGTYGDYYDQNHGYIDNTTGNNTGVSIFNLGNAYGMFGINDSGQFGGGNLSYNFIGSYSSGAFNSTSIGSNFTATGINNGGEVVGMQFESDQWRARGVIGSYSSGTFTSTVFDSPAFTELDSITAINNGGTIVGTYTDSNNVEHAFIATPNGDNAPTGSVTISGTLAVGQTLSAATSTIQDTDGLGQFHYQWQRSTFYAEEPWTNVGTDQATYTPTAADANDYLRVWVTYTDSKGYADSLESGPTNATVDTLPSGSVTISGTAALGQTLTADTSTIQDPDGLGPFHYQWQDSADNGATWNDVGTDQATYVPDTGDLGDEIRVIASYTDSSYHDDSLTSNPTAVIPFPDLSGGHLKINLEFNPSDTPPAGFEQAVEQAASILSAAIHDDITVNIAVDFSGSGDSYGGPAGGEDIAYPTVRNFLLSSGAPGATSLPSGSSFNGNSDIYVPDAELKLMGFLDPNDTSTVDGGVTFATDWPTWGMLTIALHELTHAMGRSPGGIFGLYDVQKNGKDYFSLDGGKTLLGQYGNIDTSDFLDPFAYLGDPASPLTPQDAFDQAVDHETAQYLTHVDLLQLGALGFKTAESVPPVVDHWKGGTGTWSTASGWDHGVPTTAMPVVIGNTANGNVTLDENARIPSLTINAGNILQVSATMSLTVAGGMTVQSGGAVQLDGGTLTVSGTTVDSGSISAVGLDNTVVFNSAIIAAGAVVQETDGTLVLEGNVNNGGTINLSASTFDTTLDIVGSVTLSGGGKVIMTPHNSFNAQIQAIGGFATLTNFNTIAGAGTITDSFLNLTNKGTLNANTGSSLTIGAVGSLISNTGTLEATSSGGLFIQDIIGNTNTIRAAGSGAEVVIGGTAINDGAATIVATGTGAHVDLNSATVRGGLLKTTGSGAMIDAVSGTTDLLGGVAIAAGATVQVNNGATLVLAGSIVNSGTVSMTATGLPTTLAISGGVTLSGNGKVALSNSADNFISAALGTIATLSNVNDTIAGAGTIGGGMLTLINSGTVNANSSTALVLAAQNITSNFGILEATSGGGLDIKGDVVNAKIIGAIGSNAEVKIESTISNMPPGIVEALGSGAHVDLVSARISGGTLKTSGSGANIDAVGATANVLSGVTIAGGTLVKVNDGAVLSLFGTIKNSGTISMGAAGGPTLIGIPGGVTLSGSGKITLSDNSNNAINASGNPLATLINAGNTIAGAGTIGDAALTLVNRATINATGQSNALAISGASITNSGTLEATASGGLVIEGNVVNSKTIEAIGTNAKVLIGGTVANTAAGVVLASGSGAHVDLGNVTLQSGTLKTSGANAVIDVVSGGIAVISGVTIAAGATVEAASGGTLMLSGTVVNSGALLASGGTIDIDGVISGGSAKIAGAGTVEIATGGSTENVTFASGGSGVMNELVLDQSQSYKGKVSGFGVNSNTAEFIDLKDINFSSVQPLAYSAGIGGGTLTVTDGTNTAHIQFVGSYTSTSFHPVDDLAGGVKITDPPTSTPAPAAAPATAALFGSYLAAGFASAGGFGNPPSPAALLTAEQPLLLGHPHP